MTVAELIEQLQQCDLTKRVVDASGNEFHNLDNDPLYPNEVILA